MSPAERRLEIARTLAGMAIEADVHHRPDLGEMTLAELGGALAAKRALSDARRISIAAMVRGRRGR